MSSIRISSMPASLLFLPIVPTPSDTVNSQKRQLAAPIILLNQNIQDSISPFYFHTLRLAVMIFTQKILPALASRKAENAPERCLSYLDGSTIKNTTHC